MFGPHLVDDAIDTVQQAIYARRDERRICIKIAEEYLAEQEADEEFPLPECARQRLVELIDLLKARDGVT